MCGIFGVIGSDVDIPAARKATDSMAHRGPDDSGEYTVNGVYLGHRRLSVIDVSSGGRQPMSTPDKAYTLVFNGEIYNHREVANEHLPDVDLVSHSDTEVLLHMMSRYGEHALQHIRGMFAFALWDANDQKLLLSTDPFGKKPLYYTRGKDQFVFASEPKALLAYGQHGGIDGSAVPAYLVHEYVPSPQSGYSDVLTVGMGCVMEVSFDMENDFGTAPATSHSFSGRRRTRFEISPINQHTWWKPEFRPKHSVSFEKAAAQFDDLLGQAVERRMVADVPVGMFLSGGLDSTTILWYMRRHATADICSFAVSFNKSSFDEASFAQLASDTVGSTHHTVQFDINTFRKAFDDVVEWIDIPFADASLVPTYVVSKRARKYMKVVLDGDGSDELLGGYGTFRAADAARAFSWVPPAVWDAVRVVAHGLPVSHEYFSFDFKLKSFLEGSSLPLHRRNQLWLGALPDVRLLDTLLTPQYRSGIRDVFSTLDALHDTYGREALFDELSAQYAHTYLHDGILVKLDRATMATGLEARTPFLDVDLAEYVMRLPVTYKRDKKILKHVMRGRIPDAIIDRPKKGFGIPLGAWLSGPLYGWACDILDPEKVKRDGMFEPAAVSALLNEHKENKRDHRKLLWAIIMMSKWYRRWVL